MPNLDGIIVFIQMHTIPGNISRQAGVAQLAERALLTAEGPGFKSSDDVIIIFASDFQKGRAKITWAVSKLEQLYSFLI